MVLHIIAYFCWFTTLAEEVLSCMFLCFYVKRRDKEHILSHKALELLLTFLLTYNLQLINIKTVCFSSFADIWKSTQICEEPE